MSGLEKGLVQLYTGEGKGKTTAALGQAVRAIGQGLRVYIIQFMKGNEDTGEWQVFRTLSPLCRIEHFGRKGWVALNGDRREDRAEAKKGFARAAEVIAGGKWDVVILDELVTAVTFGLLGEDDVLSLLDQKPGKTELVLTGHQAGERLVARADLVTEMRALKHPYERGIVARRGIEY